MQLLFVVDVVRVVVRSFHFTHLKPSPKKTSHRAIAMCALALLVLSQTAVANTFNAFGPQTYNRDKGAPATVTDNFSYPRPGDICLAKVYNGGLNHTRYDLVSSAVINFNGLEICGSSVQVIECSCFEDVIVFTFVGSPGQGYQ